MNRIRLIAAAVFTLAFTASAKRSEAQPACVTGTLASYVALGTPGCSINGIQFMDFTSSSGAVQFGSMFARGTSHTVLTPFFSAGVVGFHATLAGSLDTPTAFAAGPVGTCSSTCSYSASRVATVSISQIIAQPSFTLNGFGIANFNGSLSRTDPNSPWYGDAFARSFGFGASVTAERYLYFDPFSPVTDMCRINFSPVSCALPTIETTTPFDPASSYSSFTLQYAEMLNGFLPAGATDASSIDSADLNSVDFFWRVDALPVQTVAPEPSTWALVLTGLAGVGLARRRRRI